MMRSCGLRRAVYTAKLAGLPEYGWTFTWGGATDRGLLRRRRWKNRWPPWYNNSGTVKEFDTAAERAAYTYRPFCRVQAEERKGPVLAKRLHPVDLLVPSVVALARQALAIPG